MQGFQDHKTSIRERHSNTVLNGHIFAAAALLGGATIVLEISLTRLFSVLLFYNYVFLVLAIALLGLGLGAIVAAVLPNRSARAEEWAAHAAGIAALATVSVVMLSTRLLPAGSSLWHGGVAMLPFLAAGVAMPLLFVARPGESSRIYAADLCGAALGTVVVFGLLYLGGISAAFGAAALYGLAAWTLGRHHAAGTIGRGLLAATTVALFVVNALLQPIDVDLGRLAAGKPLASWLNHGRASVERSSWDPFSRVDVVRTPSNPLERLVFVDGAAGSPLPHVPSDQNEATKRQTELGAFPYRLVRANRALVIGSGGGIGVLYALLDGVKDVTAVEVSPGVVAAVRADGDYDGYLYDRPDVRVVTQEGRSFLDRDPSRYDVIDLSLVVSLASSQSGYALTENYLFTDEAFAAVYNHLSDNGVAAIRLYDDATLTRAFMTAAAAVRRSESSDIAAVLHLAVLFNPAEAATGSPAFYPMLIISKRPLTEEAAQQFVARVDGMNFTVLFAPFVKEDGAFGKVARGESSLASIQSELTGGVFTPPTDARPFFFEMTGGLPHQLIRTWQAVAVVLGVVTVALLLLSRARVLPVDRSRAAISSLGYFAMLGVAFMLVELSLLVRLSRVLGHPSIALTVTLGGLLVTGGVGSFINDRIPGRHLSRVIITAGAIVAALTMAVAAAPTAGTIDVGDLSLAGRIALTLLSIMPLGFAMGMLFPSGLRLMPGDATLPWAINGIASVVGSVLAVTLAVQYGYPAVLRTGAALYGLLAIVGGPLLGEPLAIPFRRRSRSDERSVAPEPAGR